MAYSEFTLAQVREKFGLIIEEPDNLFAEVAGIDPSQILQTFLKENLNLATAINTEKARSELIITPILLEVRRNFNFKVGFFSGTEFNVDNASGLNGYCDYILTASAEIYEIRTPVVTLVEAKNENIKAGLGQCIAEMVAAQIFNQRQGNSITTIYGAITTGTDWKFLKLTDKDLSIDRRDYYIVEINQILGILSTPFQVYLTVI
ncbi:MULTISPECIES: hypothetical protein [unclassified Tolypothrix]|uniref:hypothetical protein n=1 Tax=unclassified Tolypothrix TaxID=2649714 RepID=UPI0005EAB8E1|nr:MULTISPECIES: hypothetical protein [unclassified Tolypothrix]BAY92136.1 hypothetical protein NIES3275_41680 [Microchaete diplosiphon NIES-3275]EKF04641.1 hypothetical protein FDUTEX481_00798 [Tolypothrix sp. PCC 7601]MBE9084991.1 hypothetical protein [Tolypothrix sp. LEGE 11397]UYD26114.1 hypothetical protein HGR01_33230 [Tolypothrix sp. PCC 7712]UYD31647.1 hypothetical protein HG267_21290 [Tolypothrix sp. PCC 7601]